MHTYIYKYIHTYSGPSRGFLQAQVHNIASLVFEALFKTLLKALLKALLKSLLKALLKAQSPYLRLSVSLYLRLQYKALLKALLKAHLGFGEADAFLVFEALFKPLLT